MRLFKILIFSLLLCFHGAGNLHAKETDTRTWIDLFATKTFRSTTLGLIGEIYTMNNNSTLERTSIGVKGDQEIFHWLSTGAGYVLLNFNHQVYHELANRFYFQAEPRWHFSRFHFSLRERMQITLFPNSRTGETDSYYWRNRLEAVFRNGTKKISPLASLESLYLLNNLDINPFTEFRVTLGANYLMDKNHYFKFYGMFTDGTHLNRYILGLMYNLKL